MRVSTGGSPLKNGGYLHRSSIPKEYLKAQAVEEPTIDAAAMIEDWTETTDANMLASFAIELGVTPESLKQLCCCRSISHRAWAFPMRCGASRIIGIRLRYDDGTKRAVKGSRSGIFIPMTPPKSVCFICEGPTDCAAGLSMGLFAIGRPSCSGGTTQLWAALRERRVIRAVIIADNDHDKFRPDGQRFNPGMDGATRLCDELDIPTCLLIPPCKDLREFVGLGGTKELIESMIKNLIWHQPKRITESSLSQQRGTDCTEEEISCQETSPFSSP